MQPLSYTPDEPAVPEGSIVWNEYAYILWLWCHVVGNILYEADLTNARTFKRQGVVFLLYMILGTIVEKEARKEPCSSH